MKLRQSKVEPNTRSVLEFDKDEIIDALKEKAKKEGYDISDDDQCTVWHPSKECTKEKTSLVIDKDGENFGITAIAKAQSKTSVTPYLKLDITFIDTIVNARTRNQLATIRKGGRSEKEVTEFGRELVNRWNSQPDLLKACEAWMKVESEMKDKNPCPDLALRAQYRKQAVELTEAAIAKVQSKTSVTP